MSYENVHSKHGSGQQAEGEKNPWCKALVFLIFWSFISYFLYFLSLKIKDMYPQKA